MLGCPEGEKRGTPETRPGLTLNMNILGTRASKREREHSGMGGDREGKRSAPLMVA